MRLHLNLRQQLILSYLPLVLIPIVLIGVFTRIAAERGLTILATAQGNRLANQLAPRFADHYRRDNSWDGVEALFDGRLQVDPQPNRPQGNNPQQPQNPPPGQGGRPPFSFQPEAAQIILTDIHGIILASNTVEIIGQSLPQENTARGVPIFGNGGEQVGTLIVGAALGVLDQAEKQLLETINRALLIAGLISAILSIATGLWLSGQISAPIAALTRGVRGLASGQWSKPIPIYAQNELGELTSAFNHMAEDLTRQQNLRKQMIADIAHDLRTPLSVMTLEIEGIREGLQTPSEAAQSLQEEVEWLGRLVNDLHLLTLLDAGQLAIHNEPTDLTIFLDSVYKHWLTTAEQQHHQLILQKHDPLPTVVIDSARMRQVLGNLLNNAIQHTPPQATITLKAQIHSSMVSIQVIDTGQGIPKEALPHLFERFYRQDKSRHRKSSGGSGLGLSIAYQLTTLQNGILNVESVPGQTTFTVLLPIHNPHSVVSPVLT